MKHIGVEEESDEEGEEEVEEEMPSDTSNGSDDVGKDFKEGNPDKLHSEIRELSEEDRKSSLQKS